MDRQFCARRPSHLWRLSPPVYSLVNTEGWDPPSALSPRGQPGGSQEPVLLPELWGTGTPRCSRHGPCFVRAHRLRKDSSGSRERPPKGASEGGGGPLPLQGAQAVPLGLPSGAHPTQTSEPGVSALLSPDVALKRFTGRSQSPGLPRAARDVVNGRRPGVGFPQGIQGPVSQTGPLRS